MTCATAPPVEAANIDMSFLLYHFIYGELGQYNELSEEAPGSWRRWSPWRADLTAAYNSRRFVLRSPQS
jgi:hypothetical protein